MKKKNYMCKTFWSKNLPCRLNSMNWTPKVLLAIKFNFRSYAMLIVPGVLVSYSWITFFLSEGHIRRCKEEDKVNKRKKEADVFVKMQLIPYKWTGKLFVTIYILFQRKVDVNNCIYSFVNRQNKMYMFSAFKPFQIQLPRTNFSNRGDSCYNKKVKNVFKVERSWAKNRRGKEDAQRSRKE